MSELRPLRERQYTHHHTLDYWAEHMDADVPERFGLASPILDLGCGSGEKAVLWARRGYVVTGLDIADYCVDWCAHHRGQEPAEVQGRLHFVQADLREKWPFPAHSFASAFCSDVWEHLPERYNHHLFAEIHRVLKPGGQALIIVPEGKAYRSIDHIQEFTVADVRGFISEWGLAFSLYRISVEERRIHLWLTTHSRQVRRYVV